MVSTLMTQFLNSFSVTMGITSALFLTTSVVLIILAIIGLIIDYKK